MSMRLFAEPTGKVPVELKLHQASAILEVKFDDDTVFHLPCEYLRVFTPSAEAQGHAPGQEILQTGKENVTISDIKPVGNYAVAFQFSDGHDSGIYSWDLLYKLGNEYDSLWQHYLNELKAHGIERQAPSKS